jgi:hypothetical protein
MSRKVNNAAERDTLPENPEALWKTRSSNHPGSEQKAEFKNKAGRPKSS